MNLLRYEFLGDNMLFLLIEAGDVLYNITTYAKGMTADDFAELSSLTVCELLIEDEKTMQQKFAIMALEYLPNEHIKNETDLMEQLALVMSLNHATYVIGLLTCEDDLNAAFMGLKNPVEGVAQSYVRHVKLAELHSPY